MENIIVERARVNPDVLDAELRSALGDLCFGVSSGRGQVTVHLDDAATQAQINQAQKIVADHDETQNTPAQQARQALEMERESFAVPLNPQKITLKNLAARVAWLEKELRQARGL